MSNEKNLVDIEKVLEKATDPNDENSDELAVGVFCTIVRHDPYMVEKSTDLLLNKIKSKNVTQSKKAIKLLDECMTECGTDFQIKVARFHFLNELIRLVSKKHLADKTPPEIRKQIMELLLLWTMKFPDYKKIKETYDMLHKEDDTPVKLPSSIIEKQNKLMSTENEQMLRKLLQSKNPDDILKANLLIKDKFKEDIKKNELKRRQKEELEKAKNIIGLFEQILNCWNEENGSKKENKGDSLSLMEDLYSSCKECVPIINRLPDTISTSDEVLLVESLSVNDSLMEVMKKYEHLISDKSTAEQASCSINAENMDLLSEAAPLSKSMDDSSALKELYDIFDHSHDDTIPKLDGNLKQFELLQPEPAPAHSSKINIKNNIETFTGKKSKSLLPDIDEISEDLLKKNLVNGKDAVFFQSSCVGDKTPINILAKKENSSKMELDNMINILIRDEKSNNSEATLTTDLTKEEILTLSDDDQIIDCKTIDLEKKTKAVEENNTAITEDNNLENSIITVKPLSEINVDINNITPRKERPRVLIDDPEGLRVTLNFALDQPSLNVFVIVILTINQYLLPVEDLQFDASVPKPCKLRLLPPTGNSLPGVRPFRPPAQGLEQILLLYNPTQNPVDITYIVGYRVGDDPDVIKESGIAKNVPFFCD